MALEFIKKFEVELTNACNSKCVFCPRDCLSRPLGFMNEETFRIIVNKAKELGIGNIGFSGFGEPLLNRKIADFISYLNGEAPQISVSIITNGELLAPETIDKLKTVRIEQLVISFDGYDKRSYEDQMAGLNFEQVVSNLKYLVSNGGELSKRTKIRPVLTKKFDLPQFEKMHQLLLGLGFELENMNEYYLCANRGGYLNDPAVCDDDFLRSRGVVFSKPENSICTMMLDTLQIAWNGDILLCCYDINNEAKIGNIKTSSFEEIRKQLLTYRLLGDKFPLCARCNAPYVYKAFKVL